MALGLGLMLLAFVLIRMPRLQVPGWHHNPLFYLAGFLLWVLFQYASGITLAPVATLNGLILGCAYLVLACCAATLLQHRAHWFYISILMMAVLQSAFGIFNVVSGSENLLFGPKEHYIGKATGTFVNPNHFAAYLSIAGCLALSAIMSTLRQANRKRTHPVIHWMSRLYSLEGLVLLAVFAGLLYSRSIGAIASFGAILIIAPIMFAAINNLISIKRITIGLLPIILFIIAGVLIANSSVVLDELAGLTHSIDRRASIALAAFELFQDHWLLGVGAGAFFATFPAYRNLDIGNAFYYHAHNDYIELLCEVGVLGALPLCIFMVLALRRNYICAFNGHNHWQRIIGLGALLATGYLALHSLVDFPLRVPGFTATYLCLLSINCLTPAPQKLSHRAN